jgi:hypothetical protein
MAVRIIGLRNDLPNFIMSIELPPLQIAGQAFPACKSTATDAHFFQMF